MKMNRDSATKKAIEDLSTRLGVNETEISVSSAEDKEFRDMSLGAAATGEVAAQMISYGWTIVLSHSGKSYEYRGDKYQLRLFNFNGSNHLIVG